MATACKIRRAIQNVNNWMRENARIKIKEGTQREALILRFNIAKNKRSGYSVHYSKHTRNTHNTLIFIDN